MDDENPASLDVKEKRVIRLDPLPKFIEDQQDFGFTSKKKKRLSVKKKRKVPHKKFKFAEGNDGKFKLLDSGITVIEEENS